MSDPGNGDILIERFDAIGCSNCKEPIPTENVPPFTLVNCPHCGTQHRVPARFANFILLEEFGRGGMGAVYKAYDETLGRSVAIKVMQGLLGKDRAFVEQFLQEARALAAINHPNIVQIYSYGEENGQPFIVMELVDGNRLDRIHEKEKALKETFVLKVAMQVIGGLQAAHAAGMTHGDIKPANILFDKAGHAKVADFGLARFHGEGHKPGEIWGTPFYVAPEVVRGQAPDQQADIYSLGATLYHILSGEPPFNGETVTDTVLLRFKEPAPDPRVYQPSISAATSRIILRMLEMDAFSRYPTYESLLHDITQAYNALREKEEAKQAPRSPKIISMAFWMFLIGVLVAILSAVGYYVYGHIQREQKVLATFESDRAIGRYKKQLLNGEVAWRPVFPAGIVPSSVSAEKRKLHGETVYYVAPETWQEIQKLAGKASPTDGEIRTAGEWNIAATADITVAAAPNAADSDDNFLLLQGGQDNLADARKIYARFSIKGLDRKKLSSASLQLTVARRASTRKKQDYQLMLWGVHAKHQTDWTDTGKRAITWETAPANDTSSSSALLGNQATLLAQIQLTANPEAGDRILIGLEGISSQSNLLRFLQQYPEDTVTLVLTSDDDTEQKNPWRFSSHEDDRFPAPILLLKFKN